MDGWLVETAACYRARLAKKEGEHGGVVPSPTLKWGSGAGGDGQGT